MTAFGERLTAAKATRDHWQMRRRCITCRTLDEMTVQERTEYAAAVTGGDSIAIIAEALGVKPGTLRQHISSGHDSLR